MAGSGHGARRRRPPPPARPAPRRPRKDRHLPRRRPGPRPAKTTSAMQRRRQRQVLGQRLQQGRSSPGSTEIMARPNPAPTRPKPPPRPPAIGRARQDLLLTGKHGARQGAGPAAACETARMTPARPRHSPRMVTSTRLPDRQPLSSGRRRSPCARPQRAWQDRMERQPTRFMSTILPAAAARSSGYPGPVRQCRWPRHRLRRQCHDRRTRSCGP